MMRFISFCLIIGLSLALGCAKPEEPEEIAPAETAADIVTRAVAMAKEIEADPDSVDAVLARHEMTVEQFDQMMYDISIDPALSDAYAAAMAE
jgi:hypothetical protein